MDIRFEGRVAIVTGAGAGLGRIYALELAKRGCKVVVNDLGASVAGQNSSVQVADSVVAEIRAAGGQALASYDSVSCAEGAGRIVETAMSGFGGLDILVNNAGNLKMAPLASASVKDIEAQVGVHLLGALFCCRAAIPHMHEKKYGRIVLTSSGSGLSGFAAQAPYGAAKTAMLGLMNCLVQEHGADGIQVNTLVPTAVTRMSDGLLWPQLERFLRPELVAPAVLWMASERCSVNGEMFAAAGGHFARLEVRKASGMQFDPSTDVTPEMFDGAFQRIMDMSESTKFHGTQAAMEKMLAQMRLL